MAFEPIKKTNPMIFLYLALMVIVALLVIDLNRTPEMMIGYFFIIPVVLSYFTVKPRLIFLVAGISTIASLIGFFFAPVGFTSNIAINRPFSILTV
ncbi:MAG: hypothetical protein ABR986_01945, partial [Methanomassiliicoccales archaeon]